MKNRKPLYGSIGSVSHATMREQDLIPSFIWEAQHLRLTREERKKVTVIARRVRKIENGRYGDDDAYWTDETACWDLEKLSDILNDHSLPYFYFGAHPGDGSDFGWWLSLGFEQDFDGLKVSDTSEVPRNYTGEVLHVNDHGNCTLYAYSRGRSREVWAVV